VINSGVGFINSGVGYVSGGGFGNGCGGGAVLLS
jgi:hypothetical protein